MGLNYKYKVIDLIRKKYPNIYSDIGLTEKFNDQQVEVEDNFYNFVSLRKYMQLNDVDLNTLISNYRFFGRLTVGLFISLLIFGIMKY